MAVNSKIYIDKTEIIQELNTVVNTQQRFISVSRPRRFGKTMTADMICAYFDREADGRNLFKKRKLAYCQPVGNGEQMIYWDIYLSKFDVIRIVMTQLSQHVTDRRFFVNQGVS